jgi:hypothetical protein
MNLKKVMSEADGDHAGTTSHATKVEGFYVATQLVFVDDHGRERGRRVEETAIDYQDVDVFRFNTSLSKQVVKSTKHYLCNSSYLILIDLVLCRSFIRRNYNKVLLHRKFKLNFVTCSASVRALIMVGRGGRHLTDSGTCVCSLKPDLSSIFL